MNKDRMTLVGSAPAPGSTEKTQRNAFVSNNYCNTTVNTTSNTLEQKSEGVTGSTPSQPFNNETSAETKALHLLKGLGFSNIQQLDWIAKNPNGEWIVVEVKEKYLFEPGEDFPHYGAGLNKRQLYLRNTLREELRLRTYLINFVKGSDEVYSGYLDDLESKGEFYDTKKNKIRIYPINNFSNGGEAIRRDLNGG